MTHTSINQHSARKWRRTLALLTVAASSTIPLPGLMAQERSANRYTATVRAIEIAEPAVVNIEGNKATKTSAGSRTSEANVNGMGAGVIIDSRGYILTNQHVVQDVKRIEVTMYDGSQYVGRLIARDADTDLAVIKIDASHELPVIPCGTSSDLMRGERVVAIGNPFGYHDSVSEGIISALHRNIPVNGVQEYPDLIQTDASINPGNSGGPLLNADGKMVGINAAVRIGAQGIGFAIPIDRASEVAATMIAQNENQANLSAQVKTEYRNGQSLVRVTQCSTGELRPNDIVRQIGNRQIKNRLDYELALIGLGSSTASMIIERNGQESSMDVAVSRNANTSASSTKIRLAATTLPEDRIYRELGMKLEPIEAELVRKIDPAYKGGMRITNIRQGSPAQRAELQRGDILVGLVGWQTTSWGDLEYVLDCKEWAAAKSPEIHIIRNKNVYSNKLDISSTRAR